MSPGLGSSSSTTTGRWSDAMRDLGSGRHARAFQASTVRRHEQVVDPGRRARAPGYVSPVDVAGEPTRRGTAGGEQRHRPPSGRSFRSPPITTGLARRGHDPRSSSACRRRSAGRSPRWIATAQTRAPVVSSRATSAPRGYQRAEPANRCSRCSAIRHGGRTSTAFFTRRRRGDQGRRRRASRAPAANRRSRHRAPLSFNSTRRARVLRTSRTSASTSSRNPRTL